MFLLNYSPVQLQGYLQDPASGLQNALGDSPQAIDFSSFLANFSKQFENAASGEGGQQGANLGNWLAGQFDSQQLQALANGQWPGQLTGELPGQLPGQLPAQLQALAAGIDGNSLPTAAALALQSLQTLAGEISARLAGQQPDIQQLQAWQSQLEQLAEKLADQLRGSQSLSELASQLDGLQQQLARLGETLGEKLATPANPDSSTTLPTQLPTNATTESLLANADAEAAGQQAAADLAQMLAQLNQLLGEKQALRQSLRDELMNLRERWQLVSDKLSATNAQLSTGQSSGPVIFQANYGAPANTGTADLVLKPVPQAVVQAAMQLLGKSAAGSQADTPQSGAGNERSLTGLLNGTAATATASTAAGNTTFGQTLTQFLSQAMPAPLTQNLHRPEWGGAVGERLQWMLGNGMQQARIQISPAHLGPLEIKLRIDNNLAHVSFVSQHQVVRDALEQAVPRLREMLEQQDLDLADVDIGSQSGSGDAEDASGAGDQDPALLAGTADDAADTQADEVVASSAATLSIDTGLLDLYA